MRRAALLLALCATAAVAQVPPGPEEIAQYTGLHAAAAHGDLGSLERLLSLRPNIEERDRHGRTPLHVAVFMKHRNVVRELLKRGANANALEDRRYDPVTIAAVADDPETLRILLAGGASAKNVTSPYDGTALIAAAHLGHETVVQELIKAGAPLDHVNNLGWTALIESIVLGNGGKRHIQTLRYLVEARANVNLADRNGKTPLALARERGFGEMAAILQAREAR
ncbi:MAG: ankyrin repeat domain-containing protein [Betaproteobacteria bacterium]|nr:ankyrin repeat domain-containing protein [Betaproteobacteria bacterium]